MAMGWKRFSQIAFTTILLIGTQALGLDFPVSRAISPVVAQMVNEQKAEADRLLKQGSQQVQTGQFEAAIKTWQQALIIYHKINDRQGERTALDNLGVAYVILRDYAKARDYFQQSLAIAREIHDHKGELLTLDHLGFAYYLLGDYAKARDYFQQSLAIARAIPDREDEGLVLDHLGRALTKLGHAYLDLGDYAKAIDYYQQCLAIAREIHDRQSEGAALGNLGNAYNSLGNYDKAIDYYQQSLVIVREIHDHQDEAYVLIKLGDAYYSLSDYAKAIDYYQQALAIARAIPDRQIEVAALRHLGNAYYSLDNYAKAIDYSQQWLAIARKIPDRESEGEALGKLGNAYYSLSDYAKAIDYSQQSLAVARAINDRPGEGLALGNLGDAYRYLGDYAKAIDYYQQSLAIEREIHNRHNEGVNLLNLGIVYRHLGNYDKVIDYSQQVLTIAREINDLPGEGSALGNLGNAYSDKGDYAKAIDYYQKWLVIERKIHHRIDEGVALGGLGNAYGDKGDYDKAIDYHQQGLAIAREINDRQDEGVALGGLGNDYDNKGDYAKAIDYYQQVLTIAREIHDSDSEGLVLNDLGQTLYKQGNLKAAKETLYAAINVLESLRAKLGNNDANKISIFERQSSAYRHLQQVLIARKEFNEALEIAERGRARAFVELLARQVSPNQTTANTVTPLTVEQMQQIAQTENATLVQYSIVYDKFKLEGKQQSHESALYIWVIKPTGEITFRKVDLNPLWQKQNTSLNKLINTTRYDLGVDPDSRRPMFDIKFQHPDNQEELSKNLQQLHQILIAPIAKFLPTDPNERVIFVPQSELFLVPFAALKDEHGKYLIEQHTILTAPSIQVLDLTHASGEKVKHSGAVDALVVGNPTMPKIPPEYGEKPLQLISLPGAKKEAEDIAPLLNTKALTGDEATKAAVLARLPQAKFIHLATHGLFDDFQGLQSAIVLAPNPSATPGEQPWDNSLLTAEEILKLKLNADLVVLSACNTGRGRITGDGVIGLSRSLFIAGTPSVIVSLWSVPDTPTAKLMTDFYTNLYQKKLDKAQSLRMAMLHIMENHRDNPRDWAAFTLIGEAK